ncbi:membrane-associated protein, putative [Bodo saltans]|uniref:Membrane-associated protein, putative n=1 Tax=Bodo saltans TaxID=75058 RepID=A0A0S4JS48_BODSA|nr:membrane-associated protein, putative [Bodo saltans]|eukprot:CUG94324.1 membrane-associated protein, putative [Bodo saltans]
MKTITCFHRTSHLLVFAAVVCLLPIIAASNDPLHYTQRAADLNTWLRFQTSHVSPPLIEVAATEAMGLGVVVGREGAHRIRAGTRLLELPINATFCRERLAQRQATTHEGGYGSILAQADEEQMVTLSILTEYALGDASQFAPWIRAMPTPDEIQTPFQWSKEERQLIEPRSLAQMVATVERSVRQGFDNAKRYISPLQAFVKKRKATVSPRNDDAFSFERYCWARSLVDTRAWNMQGKKYLVPVADFFNHDEDEHDRAYSFTYHVHARSQKFMDYHMISHSKGVKVLRVLSDRDGGAAGSPLCESYGDNTNDIYLPYHGFLPAVNRRDCQSLRLGRGLIQRDRAVVDAELLRIVSHDRGVQGHFDLWSVPVCVHRGEYPPLLEVAAWLVALGLTEDEPLKSMLKDCVLSQWNQRGQRRPAQAGYQREDQLRIAMRDCLLERESHHSDHLKQDASGIRVKILQTSSSASVMRFVNRSHRIQHVILTANAKEDFSTLKLDAEVAALQQAPSTSSSTSVGHHRITTIMSLRKARKEYLKGALQAIRESQKAATTYLQGQLRLLHPTGHLVDGNDGDL